MRVGVLGGGLQGCCIALALAERGAAVSLFDRNEQLLSRTAIGNEGKIHLGYMYANDPSYATARIMIQGAFSFAPFLARHLGVSVHALPVSHPAAYVVHRDSQRTLEQASAYLRAVHAMVRAASSDSDRGYFSRDVSNELRQWSRSELEAQFDPGVALAAFDTPEVAIDPAWLAERVRGRIAGEPRIEVRSRHDILSVEDDGLTVVSSALQRKQRDRFDHVVNALWDGRFAINEKLGLRPARPWLHRLKYGVSFRLPPEAPRPPSATFISGPFGEVVSHPDGLTYLTWYPTCLRAITDAIAPPDWPTYPGDPIASEVLEGTLRAMAGFVHSLRLLRREHMQEAVVKGGAIVAWGDTDIYDPGSELHRRFEIGVTSTGRFHSVDPGKLTMAPYFADVCATRILEDSRF